MANGLALVNKPKGITSFDVVARVRKLINQKKVGHAGTLDPMATGLMLVGVGQGTKLLSYLVGLDKQYRATIRLGQATVSDDVDGSVTSSMDASFLTALEVDAEIAKLRGSISQLPSSVSAKKVDGKRAYDLVREGKEFELKPKDVVITRFDRVSELRVHDGLVDFDVIVDCSTGTYIRALARDIGQALGVGGHLIALERTRVGNYLLSDAQETSTGLEIESLVSAVGKIMPLIELSTDQVIHVRHGKPLAGLEVEGRVGLVHEGSLIGISSVRDGLLRSEVVFN